MKHLKHLTQFVISLSILAFSLAVFAEQGDTAKPFIGPVVLGLIIEAVSGQDYYEYIRTNIYQPADMAHSDHFDKFESTSGKATGYFVPRNGSATPVNEKNSGVS